MHKRPTDHEAEGVSPVLVAEPWPGLIDAREALIPEEVAEMRDLLAKNGIFQGFSELVAKALEESEPIALQVEPDADEGPIDPEVLRTASVAALRALYTELLEAGTDESFRTHFTHDALAHAVAWATGDLLRSTPREQLLGMDAATFREAYDRAYRSKDYLSQALIALMPSYVELAGQAVLDVIAANPDAPNLKDRLEAAFRQALSNDTVSGRAEAMPNIVEDGHLLINATQVAFALLTAIHDAGTRKGWDDFAGQRAPTYTTQTGKKSKEPGQIYISVRNKQEDITPDTTTLDGLWAGVGKLDDLASDVLLVCLASCTKADGTGRFDVDAFLDARGLKRKKYENEPGNWQHGHRQEDRVAVGHALEQLESLWIEVQNVELTPAGKRRKAQRFTHESRALAVVDRVMQSDLEGDKVVRAARVVLGSWVNAYKEAEITQLGFLAQKALTYDPYRNQPEKRIAKYLAFHYRYNASRPAIRRKVCDLLETANIPADAGRPNRAQSRLDKALDRLQEDGVIGIWRPLIEPGTQPARGWFAPWLQSMIEIEPPEFIQAKYAKIRA